jgi:membrane protease YdiL (CAAX protease family)
MWTVASQFGAFVLSFFFGVVFGATGLHARIPSTDQAAFFEFLGGCGASIVFLWGALRQGDAASGGELKAKLGDGPISRRVVVCVICIGIAAYVALLSIGVVSANPQFFSRALGVSWSIRSLLLLLLVIVAPLAEELFFRGRFWTALRGHWGPLATGVCTAALWLAIHLPGVIGRTVLLLPLALALSFAREFTGSVRAPILIHVCNNAASGAMPLIFLSLGWVSAQ